MRDGSINFRVKGSTKCPIKGAITEQASVPEAVSQAPSLAPSSVSLSCYITGPADWGRFAMNGFIQAGRFASHKDASELCLQLADVELVDAGCDYTYKRHVCSRVSARGKSACAAKEVTVLKSKSQHNEAPEVLISIASQTGKSEITIAVTTLTPGHSGRVLKVLVLCPPIVPVSNTGRKPA